MNFKPLIAAGTLLGIGMGGFVDGIVFHQVLQTHSMLSAKLPQDELVNVKTSMVWDGLFHAFTWLATAIAIILLWNAGKRSDVPWSGKTMFGASVMGWGIFNLVEGLIDHYALQIHHVVEIYGLSIYDHLYLASGIIFIIIGRMIIKKEVLTPKLGPALSNNSTSD
ncbi:DUF2243 domain-containing protein [Aridibaculum aurantiacum]|uniref:DUF2243 domain-containing protein n=1 Tax=Aridibaculum aurantiacum TaxID=2810307 RepID=UPI001A96B498|nr:DUF2243 domain-containing protein [Aridibaculum aurantiacum]